MVSFLFIICVLVVLAFACVLTLLLLLSSRKSSVCLDHEQSFEIIKLVEAVREILPLSSSRGWTLLSSHCGLRCWKKQFTFPILGSYTTVYGSSIKIPASAVTVLNVIADVSTWSEWNPLAQENLLHLEVSEEVELQGDHYMQSDNLVSSKPGSNSKPNIIMHRFGNLENNGVGWILIWHINQYNWYFYVAQPVETYLGDKPRHCLLTAVHGTDQFISRKEDIPQQLAANLQNLNEAIAMSTVQIRPFMPLLSSPSSSLNNPHLPTVHSALSDLPDVPCVLLHLEDSKDQCTKPQRNSVLTVVPFSFSKPVSFNNLVGFALESRLLKILDSRERVKKISLQPPWIESKTRGRFRMGSDSMTSQDEGDKVTFVRKRSASIGESITSSPPSVTVTKPEDEDSTHSLPHQSSHSFLDVIFHRRKSSDSPSKRSRSPSPLRRFGRNVRKTLTPSSSREDLSKSVVSESTNAKLDHDDKLEAAGGNDYDQIIGDSGMPVDLNDVSDSESVMLKKRGTGEPEDFKAVGNYSVSALLAETVRACVIDIHSPEEEQKKITGGWLFQDLQKDIILLKKTTNIGSVSITSYLSKGTLSASPSVVWNTLCNPLTRFMYDDTVKKISVLQEFPNGQKIVHAYHESLTLLKKEIQDFCVLQTTRQEGEQMVVAFHSIDCDNCPPTREVIRGTMLPSGWIVQPEIENNDMSTVMYLLQLIVSNPENQLIEEMGNTQPQCIQNLAAYLASKPLC